MRSIQTDVRTLNDDEPENQFFHMQAMQMGWMNAIKQVCHGFEKGSLIK